MTNKQVALLAAATFCAPVTESDTDDVKRIAEKFLTWLVSS